MSQSPQASARITVPYTVSGRHHKARAYCKGVAAGGAHDWTIKKRDGTTDIDWQDAASGFAYCVGLMLPTGVSYADLVLEVLNGIVWVPKAFMTYGATPGTGTLVPYSQVTITFRDTDFKKIKFVVVDTSQSLFQQSTVPTAGDTNMDALLVEYSASGTKTAPPYQWQVSLENLYLNTAPFVSFSTWPNSKLAENQGI